MKGKRTRTKIYKYICFRYPESTTASQISDVLKLSRQTVRHHVKILVAENLVKTEDAVLADRKGNPRPMKAFSQQVEIPQHSGIKKAGGRRQRAEGSIALKD